MIEIRRLESTDSPLFEAVCAWSQNWWGSPQGRSEKEVRYMMARSLKRGCQLPQTFVAVEDGQPVGMYQFSMRDDNDWVPDLYPWLANVYVEETHRGQGICRAMMESVPSNARAAGIENLYLYTHHVGLYEKFGWKFLEVLPSFRGAKEPQRVFFLDLSLEANAK